MALSRACELIEADRRGHEPARLDRRAARPSPAAAGDAAPVAYRARAGVRSAGTGREPNPHRSGFRAWIGPMPTRPMAPGPSPCRPGAATSPREVDLVEEVARVHGYDRIPRRSRRSRRPRRAPAPRLARDARLRTLARAAGFSECVTFSFIERRAALRFADEQSLVTIANPLSETFAVHAADAAARPGRQRRAQPAAASSATCGCSSWRTASRASGASIGALALAWTGQASGAALERQWPGRGSLRHDRASCRRSARPSASRRPSRRARRAA